MWRKGRKRFDSDGDSGAPPSKRPAAGAGEGPSEDPEEGIVVCEISKNRRVAVRSWNGNIMVDIREFYVKDGKTLPTKKGIALSMDQWKKLRDNIEEIDQAVQENA